MTRAKNFTNFRILISYKILDSGYLVLWASKERFCFFDGVIGDICSSKPCRLTFGKEFVMWDDDPEIIDAFEDYDDEYEGEGEGESDEDLSELGFDSVVAADAEDDTFDKDGDFFDDED